jgi:hypothetical protein
MLNSTFRLKRRSPQRACKPGFVSGASEETPTTIIPLRRRLPDVSSGLPGSRSEPDRLMLPVWPCTGWGLPSQASRPACWCALTAPFHPYRLLPREDEARGGLLSVALSLILRSVDVIHHPVLRCPDFPPARFNEPNRRPSSPLRGQLNSSRSPSPRRKRSETLEKTAAERTPPKQPL